MAGSEPTADSLACVTCRSRKLKCDRVKPACTRCAKVNIQCDYPESRRKPAFKRRNVNELEARLAQVEELLKDAGERGAFEPEAAEPEVEVVNDDFSKPSENVFFQGIDFPDPNASASGPYHFGQGQGPDPAAAGSSFNWELMDLGGLTEAPPPFEIIEELHRLYFDRQQYFVPLIHPGRYMRAYYGPPSMKPPMCLQYAIWAMAAADNPKYSFYFDIFYKRCRKYLEDDEMKGCGEHFISIAHAQAWCCMATMEAKKMLFTRSSMSCARAVRLVQMLGLHRLDSPPEEVLSTLAPPQDWTELEERRRTFWGIFCIDSHCSISTGWPHLIDVEEVTTHLPAPETAFQNCTDTETSSIHDALQGAPFYSFAGSVIVCYVFNRIIKHVHRPKPSDHPENYEYGEFWNRHRNIDIMLSSIFMFLPEWFRLPQNYRDPTAVHTNLNLHASIICLHHAAMERIEKYDFGDEAKRTSRDRMLTAANEIMNITKLTSHRGEDPTSPLSALSLYVAASVFIFFLREQQQESTPPRGDHVASLKFIVVAMKVISRHHFITRAFLRQVVLDIQHTGIAHLVQLPRGFELVGPGDGIISNHIPLLARSQVSRHAGPPPPLPGSYSGGAAHDLDQRGCDDVSRKFPVPVAPCVPPAAAAAAAAAVSSQNMSGSNKRRRTSPSTSWSGGISGATSGNTPPGLFPSTSTSSPSTDLSSSNNHPSAMNLPHRTASPATNPATEAPPPQQTQPVYFNPGFLGGAGPSPFTHPGERTPATEKETWQMANACFYSQFHEKEPPPRVDDGINTINNTSSAGPPPPSSSTTTTTTTTSAAAPPPPPPNQGGGPSSSSSSSASVAYAIDVGTGQQQPAVMTSNNAMVDWTSLGMDMGLGVHGSGG